MPIEEKFNKRGLTEGLSIDELKKDIFGQHCQEQIWHEVLRLIAGNLNEFVVDVIDYLIDIYEETKKVDVLILAAECLNEVNQEFELKTVNDRLLNELKVALKAENEIRKIAKTITLYWEDNSEVMEWLEDIALNHDKLSVRESLAQGIAEVKLSFLDNRNILISDKRNILISEIGDIYLHNNQYKKALEAYLYRFKKTGIFNIRIGQLYNHYKWFTKAISYYKQWLKKEPKNQLAYNGLGNIYRQSGCYDKAIDIFKLAIKIVDKDTVFILNFQGLGQTYHDLGKYKEAITTYHHVIDIDPKNQLNSQTYNNLGFVYYHLGQYDNSIAAYNQAINFNTRNIFTYNNFGCLYRIRKQWQEAINIFNASIEINPLYSIAYANLGLVYLLQNNFIEAEHAFSTAIKVNSYDGNAVLSLGILQGLQGNIDQAKISWNKGLKLYGEYAQYHRLYRTLYTIALGEIQQGLTTLQQIISQEKPTIGLLNQVLEIAYLLQKCPQLEGINEAITIIEQNL